MKVTGLFRRVVLVAALLGLVAGVALYHEATGARFVVELQVVRPTSSQCNTLPPCPFGPVMPMSVAFHGIVTNVGNRGSNLVCTVTEFDAKGRVVFAGPLPTWSYPTGPYLAAGAAHSWTAALPLHPIPAKRAGEFIPLVTRLAGSCRAIDYHGSPPV